MAEGCWRAARRQDGAAAVVDAPPQDGLMGSAGRRAGGSKWCTPWCFTVLAEPDGGLWLSEPVAACVNASKAWPRSRTHPHAQPADGATIARHRAQRLRAPPPLPLLLLPLRARRLRSLVTRLVSNGRCDDGDDEAGRLRTQPDAPSSSFAPSTDARRLTRARGGGRRPGATWRRCSRPRRAARGPGGGCCGGGRRGQGPGRRRGTQTGPRGLAWPT